MANNQVALVLEGGGFRGMYTSGVVDAFLKQGIQFPYCTGVSAGAAYGISYVSEQFGRNKEVNLKYTADPRYMSVRNLIRKGNLFDWDFVYGEIPYKLVPFDYDTFFKSETEFKIGITHVKTGETHFPSKRQLTQAELMQVITASSSLPFVSKMARYKNEWFMDGGITASIPFEQAFKDGYKKAVVVLTRNVGYYKQAIKHPWIIKTRYRKYPQLVKVILSRAERYNKDIETLERLEKEGAVFIIRPQGTMNVSRIENNPQKLDHLYMMGLKETEDLLPQLNQWLNK
ncbi:MAG: patatin family protein [Marinilabiliaceae bacterium]|nr:patatin family protein [Marinilabiliaceae bacterium]